MRMGSSITSSGTPSGYAAVHLRTDKAVAYAQHYRQGYDADEWVWVERPYLQQLFERLRDQGMRRYADLACGTGRVLAVGAAVFPEATGFDVSDSMLAVAATEVPAARLVTADVTELDAAERFDVLTAFRLLLNAEDEVRTKSIAAAAAHLAPGGVLIVNTHTQPWSPLGLTKIVRSIGPTPWRTLSGPRLARMMRDAGLVVDEMRYYGLLPRPGRRYPGWYRRWHERIETRQVPRWARPFAQSVILVARRP